MDDYIREAVIDDLAKFIDLSYEEARASVYDIMYLAVCDSNVTKIEYPEARKENETYRDMLTAFGIDSRIKITPVKFKMVSEILEKANFILKTYNIVNDEEYRLHLVNPSLTYQMVSALFDRKSAEERVGKSFESYFTVYMSTRANTADHIWYADMGQLKGNPELELIIVNPDDHLVYLFDFQLREVASLPETSSLLSEKLETMFTGAEIGGRYAICSADAEKRGIWNGKKVIFTRMDHEILENYRRFDENYERLSDNI